MSSGHFSHSCSNCTCAHEKPYGWLLLPGFVASGSLAALNQEPGLGDCPPRTKYTKLVINLLKELIQSLKLIL